MRRRLSIGDFLSEETLAKLASATDEQIDNIEDNVYKIMDEILSRGIISNNGVRNFAEEISSILQPRGNQWQQIKNQIRNKKGREPTDLEVAREMKIELLLQPGGKTSLRRVKELYNLEEAIANAEEKANLLSDHSIRKVVSDICHFLICPNLSYNEEMTKARREEKKKSVQPIKKIIPKGEIILNKGEKITEAHQQKLMAVNSFYKSASVEIIGGITLVIAFLIGLLILYLKQYEPNIFKEYRKLMSLSITILVTAMVEKLIIAYSLPYPLLLIPAVITPAMVAILISPRLAMLVTVVVGIFIGIMSGANVENILERLTLVIGGGMMAVFSFSSSVKHRKDVMKAGLYVCIASAIIIGTSLGRNDISIGLLKNIGWGILSGLAIVVIIPGLLPVFEYLAKTPTDIQLLELSDLNTPLLNELEKKAPGTYHHSINVSKLAESAAEEIGANPLLVRVGAYYHDIGKMEEPKSFIENQDNGNNIHDNLPPEHSVEIIKAHVTNGIEKAKKHRLPKIIEDIIAQHHGTTMIGGTFFYDKAIEESEERGTIVKEDDFRYSGPRPQMKEAAIILLADSVEAASRTMVAKRQEPFTYKELKDLEDRKEDKMEEESTIKESPKLIKLNQFWSQSKDMKRFSIK